MNALTAMHLKTARMMPRKRSPILIGERAAKWERQVARERKLIAAYYLALRQRLDLQEVPGIAHRYAVVTTATEAKIRLKAMS